MFVFSLLSYCEMIFYVERLQNYDFFPLNIVFQLTGCCDYWSMLMTFMQPLFRAIWRHCYTFNWLPLTPQILELSTSNNTRFTTKAVSTTSTHYHHPTTHLSTAYVIGHWTHSCLCVSKESHSQRMVEVIYLG